MPGKPKVNRSMVSEMESRLAKRRDKVDAESYVSEGPDPIVLPPEPPSPKPPKGNFRKPSTASLDSGRGDSIDPASRASTLEPGGYARVSVDQERKEELMMAKCVRKSSAKMLQRGSYSPIESPVTVSQECSPPPNLPPPSAVVMRYWNQNSSTADSGYFGEEGIDTEEPPKG